MGSQCFLKSVISYSFSLLLNFKHNIMFRLLNIAVNQYKIKHGQWLNKSSGTWCNRQFYSAALPHPATVRGSGFLKKEFIQYSLEDINTGRVNVPDA